MSTGRQVIPPESPDTYALQGYQEWLREMQRETERICSTARRVCLPPLDVLVVDDNEEVREMIATALREDGLKVETAYNGASALGRVQERRYRLIVMDYRLGDMEGSHVVDLLPTEQRRTGKLLSITGLPILEESALREGYDAYLQKPVGVEQVRATVRRLIGSTAA